MRIITKHRVKELRDSKENSKIERRSRSEFHFNCDASYSEESYSRDESSTISILNRTIHIHLSLV